MTPAPPRTHALSRFRVPGGPGAACARRLCRAVAALLVLCPALGPAAGPAAAAEPPAAGEYALKAAFLYNFAKFVEWPESRFADGRSPVVIGVLGTDPFGAELEKVVRGRRINGHEIAVHRFDTADAAKSAHILFVNTGDGLSAAELRRALGAHGVLTVGEADPFTRGGGVITFQERGGRLGFEINMAAAERAGLKISAQLQKLATVIFRQP